MLPLSSSVTRRHAALCVLALAACPALFSAPAVDLSGDVRVRYEEDWDSQTASGVPRSDRERARVRARLAASVEISDAWSLGARLRTGNRDSQQSPHLSFWSSDDSTDDFEIALDRYFLRYDEGAMDAWAGRNTLPFWQQNEMIWDEDVTPTGVAFSHEQKNEARTLTTTAGGFLLPDGAVDLGGELYAGQLKYEFSASASDWTFAASFYAIEGTGSTEHLRNRNGTRDYRIGSLSAQWSHQLSATRPLKVGVDLIENFASYTAAEAAPYPPSQAGETSGYVISILLGQLKQARDWQLGYFYSQIETFAVNASYSQDDFARFGSATQSDLTGIKGHEFRVGYAFTSNLNLGARLFLVEDINTVQDGKRLRLDLNWKF